MQGVEQFYQKHFSLQGFLEKCLNPDDQKHDWKKRYFVLKKATGSGTKTLEYYKEKEWRKHEPKGVLTLFSGYTTKKIDDSKKRLVFEVKTIDNLFVLSAPTEEARDKWIVTLTKEGEGIPNLFLMMAKLYICY